MEIIIAIGLTISLLLITIDVVNNRPRKLLSSFKEKTDKKIERLECEISQLEAMFEVLSNGKFRITRNFDARGNTVDWTVEERSAFGIYPCGPTPWSVNAYQTVFKTKKECMDYIEERRKEIEVNKGYFD